MPQVQLSDFVDTGILEGTLPMRGLTTKDLPISRRTGDVMSKLKISIVITLLALCYAGALATQETTTVEFKPGTSSAYYAGSIKDADVRERGNQSDSYILGARKGQIMKVSANSTSAIYVYIWNRSQGYNKGFMLDSLGKEISTRFMLPVTGEYQVDINRAPGVDEDVNYEVEFTIRP